MVSQQQSKDDNLEEEKKCQDGLGQMYDVQLVDSFEKPQESRQLFINDDLRENLQQKLNQLLAQVILEQNLCLERKQYLETISSMTSYKSFV